jgi:hypothetical protein
MPGYHGLAGYLRLIHQEVDVAEDQEGQAVSGKACSLFDEIYLFW